MKILFCGNCQCVALRPFMERALPHHEYRHLPHLATFFKEFTEEQIADDHIWADLVFFHHKHDGDQNYPTKQPKVACAVWYQSSPFLSEVVNWEPIKAFADHYGRAAAIEYAVKEHDFNYTGRWFQCWDRMREKEEDEQVPHDLRISDLMAEGRSVQQQLTCNHPTSIVLYEWANRIVRFLGETPGPNAVTLSEAAACPNIGGMPGETSATTGAVKALSLAWGGREIDDQSGREIAEKMI